MSYVDTAVGTALFIFFMAMVLMIAIDHFLNYPELERMSDQAMGILETLLETEGSPDKWEDSGVVPTELGLIDHQTSRVIFVTEPGTGDRSDEPVTTRLVLDRDCVNDYHYELIDPEYCFGGFLNETHIKFKINISENETKRYKLYYYGDDDAIAPSYDVVYSTSSWVTISGDGWTESTDDWSRYGGSSESATLNPNEKISGSYSVQIEGAFGGGSDLGLTYDPDLLINGIGTDWYFDFWFYVNETADMSWINVIITDTTDTISSGVDADSVTGGRWYHFEKKLDAGLWSGWSTFDASSGIDSISVFMANSTPASSKQLILDEMHFETTPIELVVYPESTEAVVSNKKVSALSNLTYDQLKSSVDGDYEFRIEVS